MWSDLEKYSEQVRKMRPNSAEWIRVSETYGLLHIVEVRPATELADDWLARDLERVAWG